MGWFIFITVGLLILISILSMDTFEEKFGRSYIHGEIMVVFIVAFGAMLFSNNFQNVGMTIFFIIMCIIFFLMIVTCIKKYGFGWALLVVIFNSVLIVLITKLVADISRALNNQNTR